MSTIKLVKGKYGGFVLKVNNLFIHRSFDDQIKSIENKVGIPDGSTEWISLKDLRRFWHKYMKLIIHSTTKPYKSVDGTLIRVEQNNVPTLDFRSIKKLTGHGKYQIQVDLDDLQSTIDRYEKNYHFNFDVDFQRAHVWTEEQQSKFIEFILRGGTTTPILFNHQSWMSFTNSDDELVIVDGKQRLTALLKFMNNKLKVFGGYRLSEITNIQWGLLPSITFNVNNLKTKEEILRWYLELNTGGTPHTKEELHRVYLMYEEVKKSNH